MFDGLVDRLPWFSMAPWPFPCSNEGSMLQSVLASGPWNVWCISVKQPEWTGYTYAMDMYIYIYRIYIYKIYIYMCNHMHIYSCMIDCNIYMFVTVYNVSHCIAIDGPRSPRSKNIFQTGCLPEKTPPCTQTPFFCFCCGMVSKTKGLEDVFLQHGGLLQQK